MIINTNLTKGRLRFQFITEGLANALCSGKNMQIIAMLVFSCSILSVIIPPFQSPDEHHHIKRAYLLTKGVLVLDQEKGKSSGGYVDSGLLDFMEGIGVIKGKLSAEDISSWSRIKWSGNRVYSVAPGTGYYFPAAYFPQALGLWIGEEYDLTIDHSYRLARAFSLIAVALLLYGAFRLFPPNPLVLALIAMPMTLFQMSSASLDGVTTALAVFSISAFMKITTNKVASSAWVQYALAFAIAMLASSRIHALPLLILLAASYYYTKHIRSLILLATAAFFIFGWTLYAMSTAVDLRVTVGERVSTLVWFYLKDPLQFFSLAWHTMLAQGFYSSQFVGILGWLDTPLEDHYYKIFYSILMLSLLLSTSFRNIKAEWPQRLLLVSVSMISVLFIFFALLVTWTPHPAKLILGVQGRYFLIPSIILAYGIAGNEGMVDGFRRRFATFISFFILVFSLLITISLLVNRYYLAENQSIVILHEESTSQPKVVTSGALTQSTPITLTFPSLDEKSIGTITRIGIMFGTNTRRNPGEAELLLSAKGGAVYRKTFPLPDLVDNAYEYFRVPADHYTTGELRFISGGGIVVWGIRTGDNSFLSCLKLTTIRKQTVTINGCPK